MTSNELDLDALEKEGRPEPMTVKVRGKQFVTTDPLLIKYAEYQAVDWQDVQEILSALFAPDDLAELMALDLSQHAMNILGDRLATHYFGGESPGESDAS